MPIERILLLDTETTGLDPSKDVTIEVAVCLYDVTTASPLASYASLIRSERNEAEAVNAIPLAALREAPSADRVWVDVDFWARQADAIVAHRAEFDRQFVTPAIRDARPWICSKFDIEWPKQLRTGDGLVSLALAHGLGVASAHRAMADVDTLSRLFTRVAEMGVDLQALLAKAMRPKALYQAMVSYDDREKAKAAGFGWDGATKRWTRSIPKEDVHNLQLPFRVVEVAS